ncbi:MAG: hypothetical protein V4736_05880 [Bdellovibrionota bacterium]
MNLPQVFTDQLQKKSGLLMLAAGKDHDAAPMLKMFADKFGEGNSRRCLLIQREDLRRDQIQQKTSILNYNQLGTAPVRELLLKSDVIIMEDVLSLEELDLAIYLAEAGSLVLIHWFSRSIMMTLQRVMLWLEPHQREAMFWRLAESLHLAASVHNVRSLEGNQMKAWELVLMNSELRGLLKSADMKSFESVISTSTQKSVGTVSLNQSLLQLLIQRKIDIKAAFEASLDPEDMDALMKKVGI